MSEPDKSDGRYELPEDDDSGFDEHALEQAIRAHRRRQFAALARLDS